uniref:EOG090X089S n=1 Tax=Lynceus sp. MCZ IZ 141354 TaxID=1930659 RepID=A0A9N6WRA0_9CRUS|nr:EOG090X089S [Lynceus sp. MCZ IZ 141354]
MLKMIKPALSAYNLQLTTFFRNFLPSASILEPKSGPLVTQQRFAARKGYRASREKAKKNAKVEVVKPVFVPHKSKSNDLKAFSGPKRIDESEKGFPVDNVFLMNLYKFRVFPFHEAIQCHRESNDPTVFNNPDAIVRAYLELDMKHPKKKTRFLDPFSNMLLYPHLFDKGGKLPSILYFCKTSEGQEQAINAGAEQAGGMEMVKRIQTGEMPTDIYDFILSHTNMISDIVNLRGLLKRKYPTIKNGGLSPQIDENIRRHLNGVIYSCKNDAQEPDFGAVEIPFGRINMDNNALEDNLKFLLKDVERVKEGIVTRMLITCPPNEERFMVDHTLYVEKKATDDVLEDEEEEETKEAAQA